MKLQIDGAETYVATGGRDFDPAQPAIVFLHGAGFDHTLWALPARWFAHHGHAVLAPDLPGHGRSGGAPLTSVAALADWTVRLLAAVGIARARLVGHSMGALVALETAARAPDKVTGLSLIGVGASMRVSPDLLGAAQANHHDAVDMVSIWGHGPRAGMGGSAVPGLWMLGGGDRLLARAGDGVLHADLAACNAYDGALAAAATVRVPTTLILGERDMMTPLKSGLLLADAIAGARRVVLRGAGHMLTAERPDEVLAALRD
jgi:pimeloyl-ACP methyl ester carboxylesterase